MTPQQPEETAPQPEETAEKCFSSHASLVHQEEEDDPYDQFKILLFEETEWDECQARAVASSVVVEEEKMNSYVEMLQSVISPPQSKQPAAPPFLLDIAVPPPPLQPLKRSLFLTDESEQMMPTKKKMKMLPQSEPPEEMTGQCFSGHTSQVHQDEDDPYDRVKILLFEETESDEGQARAAGSSVVVEEEKMNDYVEMLQSLISPPQSKQPTAPPFLLDTPVLPPPMQPLKRSMFLADMPESEQMAPTKKKMKTQPQSEPLEEMTGQCFSGHTSQVHQEDDDDPYDQVNRLLFEESESDDGQARAAASSVVEEEKVNSYMDMLQSVIPPPQSKQAHLSPDTPNAPPPSRPLTHQSLDETFRSTAWTQLEATVKAITEEKLDIAQRNLDIIRKLLSQSAGCRIPIYRLAVIMHASLQCRISGKPVPAAILRSTEAIKSARLLYTASPCFRFCLTTANLAILEATKDRPSIIHIIEFDVQEQVEQLASLIHSIADRHRHQQDGLLSPAPPPVVKITAICDPNCPFNPIKLDGSCINVKSVALKLAQLAGQLDLPFRFALLSCQVWELDQCTLGCETGEALAVKFSFSLSRVADHTRDELLRRMKALNPRVVTLVEKEMNSPTPLIARFPEFFTYNHKVLESLEAAMELGNKEQVCVDFLLARKVANSITSEGEDLLERCELHDIWCDRMKIAGFNPVALGTAVIAQLIQLSHRIKTDKRVTFQKKKNEFGLAFGWRDQMLTVVSAWS